MTLLRSVPRAGTGQTMGIRLQHRRATCAEVGCRLYLEGHTFWVGEPHNRFIHHPQGAECGPRCPNDVCPCVNHGVIPGAGGYPHRLVDADRGPVLTMLPQAMTEGQLGRLSMGPASLLGYEVDLSEFVDRTAEGFEALRHLNERGI